MDITKLEPEKVFRHFQEISRIPRNSGDTKKISDYLAGFAKDNDLEYYQDDWNDVIIIKEGSEGRENEEPLIMQGHMDMVCARTEDSPLDPAKDGVDVIIDGDYLHADRTSLGGDDGIAIAMMLALLSEDIPHPRLEMVMTVNEETGMDGAENIDVSMLKGHRMINLDSEEEGTFMVSAGGGACVETEIPLGHEQSKGAVFTIAVKGLTGGHSGIEINKERANALILLGRLLHELHNSLDLRIIDIAGGEVENAIPKYASADIVIADKAGEAQLKEFVAEIEDTFKHEHRTSDPQLTVEVSEGRDAGDSGENALNSESTEHIIDFLLLHPQGVRSMSLYFDKLVETSVNLGVVKLNEDKFQAVSLIRSSVKSKETEVFEQIKTLAGLSGGDAAVSYSYPGWEFRKDSSLCEMCVSAYKKLYGEEPKVMAVHAGLECGYFAEKIKDFDGLALGPDMFEVHSVEEKLSIPSVRRVYEMLKTIVMDN